ncbi:V-type ATP synthase subunit F, partial [Peptoniphilus harei]
MYKIAVVGDKDSVLSFKAIGIDVFVAYEGKDARYQVDSLAKKDYGVIYITE